MQHRGVQVGHVMSLAQGVVTQFISRPVNIPTFQPGPGQPDGEAVRVMIATGRRPLQSGSPSELGAEDHRHIVQQAPLLQVGQEPGNRLVDRLAHPGVVLLQFLVRVPRAIGRGEHLHKADSSFHHPPCRQ